MNMSLFLLLLLSVQVADVLSYGKGEYLADAVASGIVRENSLFTVTEEAHKRFKELRSFPGVANKSSGFIDIYFPSQAHIADVQSGSAEHQDAFALRAARSVDITDLELAGSFTCTSLASVYDPFTFCSGVVDYAFVLPAGASL